MGGLCVLLSSYRPRLRRSLTSQLKFTKISAGVHEANKLWFALLLRRPDSRHEVQARPCSDPTWGWQDVQSLQHGADRLRPRPDTLVRQEQYWHHVLRMRRRTTHNGDASRAFFFSACDHVPQ